MLHHAVRRPAARALDDQHQREEQAERPGRAMRRHERLQHHRPVALQHRHDAAEQHAEQDQRPHRAAMPREPDQFAKIVAHPAGRRRLGEKPRRQAQQHDEQAARERQTDLVRVVEQAAADQVREHAADERHARQPERGGQFRATEKIWNPLRLSVLAQQADVPRVDGAGAHRACDAEARRREVQHRLLAEAQHQRAADAVHQQRDAIGPEAAHAVGHRAERQLQRDGRQAEQRRVKADLEQREVVVQQEQRDDRQHEAEGAPQRRLLQAVPQVDGHRPSLPPDSSSRYSPSSALPAPISTKPHAA